MTYRAPLKDIRFTLDHVVGWDALTGLEAFADLSDDLADAVLSEAGRLTAEVMAPLNPVGDKEGAKLSNDEVTTATGFKDAYRQWVEGGWGGVPFDPDYGGQGLPRSLMTAVQEMVQAANPSFGLCPLLTQGAIEALSAHGTQEQKDLYLPKLISGEWSGTMNLTEPQAGSDVGALKSKAEPAGDGTYKITGTKIYITWGEHDMAENIVHLVLARLPDAPPGTRGISLFLVPKFLPNADGSLGARNDLRCIGLERKLGIHGSPTCTMAFGENGGATGFLIGREHKGMAAMFTMMNNARLNVGIQGLGTSEAAFQRALAFAQDRKQGKPFGLQHEMIDMIPIIQHADVRRMLFSMKSRIEAMRAICYANALAIDLAHAHPDEAVRADAKAREELLTPISKAWSTGHCVDIASIGIQVHGGMGFVEETGAAQYLRDARIYPIYEGTNGIQAIDLVARKLPLQGGGAVERFIAEMSETVKGLEAAEGADFAAMAKALGEGAAALDRSSNHLLAAMRDQPADALAGAQPYLELFGTVAGGHFLARGALAAKAQLDRGEGDAEFLRARITIARFFADTFLPLASGLAHAATYPSEAFYEVTPAALEAQ